jgi:nucleoside-diphosphate-sugar epimerase
MRDDVLSLLTDGADLLRSDLDDTLLARGDDVIIVDNLSTRSLRNVDDAVRGGRATFVDVAQPLREICEPIEKTACFNRIPQACGAHLWETPRANATGAMGLIDLALEHHSRLVYASTLGASYGVACRSGVGNAGVDTGRRRE